MLRSLVSCALALFLLPALASAGTIYDFSSGSAVISATRVDLTGASAPSVVLLNGSPTLGVGVTGGFVEFDAGAPAVDDFLVQLADTGAIALSTSTASEVFGYVAAALEDLQIAPGAGYVGSNVGGGPGNFVFDVGPVDVSGTVFATSATPPLPPDLAGVPFSQAVPSLSGSIVIGANSIELTGIALGAIVNPADPDDVLLFKGDVSFDGVQPVIPEPTSALLFGIGAGIAAWAARSRLRTA